MALLAKISRREFVKEAGGLLVGFSIVDASILPRLVSAAPVDSGATPAPTQLDAWMRVEKDGTIRVFTGKAEIGMGVETALMQIVAEELDVSPKHVAMVMGDTSTTTDQGGVGASSCISAGAKPLRNAAAAARRLLLQLASQRFQEPVDHLEINDGVVSVHGEPGRNVSYAELAGGTDLNEALKVSGRGFSLNVEGAGKPKDPTIYKVVGQSVPRVDIAAKILGKWQYVTDVRVPEMLHGRVVRPAGVGAKLVSIDEDSVKGISGYVKTVVIGNFVGVVAENEWAAIQAALRLKATWTAPEQAFPLQADLYEYMRTTPPKSTKEGVKRGDVSAALAGAATRVEATYEFPFQSHATMGPGCAIADVQADGLTTIWSGTQKPHSLRLGIAEMLRFSPDKVRVIWVEDSGSYGRPGFEDAAADAALLSQAVGKPVRVQWMRADMTAWGTKGPAVTCDMVTGLDAQGKVSAFQFTSRAFSGGETMFQPATAGNFIGAQLTGIPNTSGQDEFALWGSETIAYTFKNVSAISHVVPAFFSAASPLRTTHLRDPEGPATTFAAESFMDEVAAAAGLDPIEFRLANLNNERVKKALVTAAEKFGWDSRPSPRKTSPNKTAHTGEIAIGRGVALGDRGGTYVATIAEVEVNRRTGTVRVRRLVCAHDCGLIVNPEALRGTIAANLMQSLSRTLKEEVTFDRSNVTSVDWRTYPIARSSDVPDQVEIVLINHPELPSTGAGEPSSRPTGAAINNAIFDATGVRIRRAPLTQERIKAALASA